MKKICLLPLLLLVIVANAQREKIWGDPHIIEKFAAEAMTNPAYSKMFNQVDALSRSASPGNTKAAEMRSLLTQNSSLLKGLYTRSGLEAAKPMKSKKLVALINPVIVRSAIAWSKMKPAHVGVVKMETPPYDTYVRVTDETGLSNKHPDTSSSQYSAGIVRLVYGSLLPSVINRRTGQHLQGFKQSFKVPDDPEIIAADVKFEYSYFYTGWDTYGAILGMDVALEINNELNGPDYNALPVCVVPSWLIPANAENRWKLIANLYPTDTIESDFGEFHGEDNHESFSIGGYVTPGKTVDVKLVMGFRKGAKRGINGSYHYAEFILKKITVTYYKSGN